MLAGKTTGLTWLVCGLALASLLSAILVMACGTILSDMNTKKLAKTMKAMNLVQGSDGTEFWVGCPILIYGGLCFLTNMTKAKSVIAVTLGIGLICNFFSIFGLLLEGPDWYHIRLIQKQDCAGLDYTESCAEVKKLNMLYCTIIVVFVINLNITFVGSLYCYTRLYHNKHSVPETNPLQNPANGFPNITPPYTPPLDSRQNNPGDEVLQIPPPPYSRHDE